MLTTCFRQCCEGGGPGPGLQEGSPDLPLLVVLFLTAIISHFEQGVCLVCARLGVCVRLCGCARARHACTHTRAHHVCTCMRVDVHTCAHMYKDAVTGRESGNQGPPAPAWTGWPQALCRAAGSWQVAASAARCQALSCPLGLPQGLADLECSVPFPPGGGHWTGLCEAGATQDEPPPGSLGCVGRVAG